MWPPFNSSYPEVAASDAAGEYDFIIVGGGTAGCVLASRLSENSKFSILLVERGRSGDYWSSRVPLLSTDFASDGSRTYKRTSEPQVHVADRVQDIFSGKGLGGTSRINSMLYTRGIAAEYNAWSESGREGWSYDDLLPLFKKSERALDVAAGPERGKHGVWQTQSHAGEHFITTKLTIEATKKLGLPYIADVNSSQSPSFGCSKAHFSIDKNGHRSSTFHAFLPLDVAIARKGNLKICTNTAVSRINITKGLDGAARAEGVYMTSAKADGPTFYAQARKEIILASGPIGSAQILLLSGVGPKSHLESLAIPVMKDLPAVGSNLQDHFGVGIVYYVPLSDSMVSLNHMPTFFREFLRYLLQSKGLLLSPVLELSIFAKAQFLDEKSNHVVADAAQSDGRNPANLPDIEIMPISWNMAHPTFDKSRGAFSFMNIILRPASTGTVRLSSTDPADAPLIDLGTLSAPEDIGTLRAALRLSLHLAEVIRADGYALADCCVPVDGTDAALDAHIREHGRTTYHYASTCRMAPEHGARPGVVDDALRVHGVRGLRVADSSVFPQIPATHLQAPAVVVAEKCAEMIKAMY